MTKSDIQCAIVFADIAGSTHLYENLGDELAQETISRCLHRLSDVVVRYGGIVIKTIGDEIMCRFRDADSAIQAACDMHELLDSDMTERGPRLEVRIGIHYGPAILQGGDVFGDAVNLSARMTSIAKARQIITTATTIECASPEIRAKSRVFDQSRVRGKMHKIDIHEVLWEQSAEVTQLAGARSATPPSSRKLSLRHQGTELHMDERAGTKLLGRDQHCDLVMPSEVVSRNHARVGYNRGKFVLVDQSTNGTYVQTPDGREVFLRREEQPLVGQGVISLGQCCSVDLEHLIYFRSD